MNTIVQVENRVERATITTLEYDPDVLEYYLQQELLPSGNQIPSERNSTWGQPSRFLVLRTHRVGLEEWLDEKHLHALAKTQPQNYHCTEEGTWRSPPGEALAAQYGLTYEVHASTEIHPIFLQNLLFLQDFLRQEMGVSAVLVAQVRRLVQQTPGITLATLLRTLPQVHAHDVYQLIAQECVYVNLYAVPLGAPRHVQLYPDQATAEAYWMMSANSHPAANTPQAHSYQSARSLIVNTTLDWGGHVWTLLNLGETVTSLLPRVGPPLHVPTPLFQQLLETRAILVPSSVDLMQSLSKADSLLAQANTASLQEANRRFVLVQAYIHRKTELYGDVPVRTLRYWKTLFERAQAHYGCGYVGLLPRIAERGNRTRKAPETSCRLMDAIIEERRELIHQRPISEAYLSYREICLANQTPPLSASTFYRRVNQLGRIQQKSTRMEFQATAQVLRGHKSHIQTTSRYGEHPWALAYFDHALLDIELRTPTTGRPLGRPWATFLVDAFSRRIFAVHLSFDPPDYLSYLMALRLCVRRHGHLPYQVVVDKGKPFQSVHVDSLLERCHCVKQTRPGKKRPLGFVLEQFCETTNSRLLQMLLSTQQGLDIHRQSFWTFAKLDEMLSEWAYQIYDRTLHSALGQSPHDAFVQGQAQSNHDQYLHIPFDQDFLVLTLPGPPKGTVTVIPGNGIKLHGIYYWNSAFRSPKVERTQVPVRYDPFDIGVAYAYVQGRWVQCVSQYFGHLHGHSVRELELACQELHCSTSAYQVSKAVTAKRVAEMFAQEEAYEALVLQHMRDLEASSSLQAIGGRRSPPLEDSLAFRNRQSGLEEPPAPIDLEQLSLYEEYR